VGIYGAVSFSVTQRTPEIGVRMALGATSSRVRAMVVAQGLRPCLVGLLLGVATALPLSLPGSMSARSAHGLLTCALAINP
jgi:ABC-type antimicrobial peptide transport system permease subunit